MGSGNVSGTLKYFIFLQILSVDGDCSLVFDMNFYVVPFVFWKPRYAYAVASALHGVQHILRKDFMLQVCMIPDESI